VYDGLQRAQMNSFCGGAFEAELQDQPTWMKQILCTHGPDPAPAGIDVRQDRGPESVATTPELAPAGGSVPCYGSGSDGYRVQLLYARSASAPDRFPTYAASFTDWSARLDSVVNASANETGGTRHVRFVTDPNCDPVVTEVALSPGAMSSFSTMASELHSIGYARSDRRYLVWADAKVYCGISELYTDDSPSQTPGVNYNNGNAYIQGSIGRIDTGCWGLPNMVEAHELGHLLGGVQTTAPHATPGYHCTDESDRMCYADGSMSAPVQQVCPPSHEAFYDCDHNDYFSTAPPAGSYLSTHWNIAASAFLSAQAPKPREPGTTSPTTTSMSAAPPTTATTSASATISTFVPSTTTTTTTVTIPPTTATSATTTMLPTAGSTPSRPRALRATQPTVGRGVQLSWQPPDGPVTGYRVYRGTSPVDQSLLATVSEGLGFDDTSAGRTIYYYRVTAFNAAGEGPASGVVAMIGKPTTPGGMVRAQVDRRLLVSDMQRRSLGGWRWPLPPGS